MQRCLLPILLFLVVVMPAGADPAPLQVQGPNLVANGQVIHLRGIDWGWWHLKNTQYTENDMKAQAGWGANFARLCFTYTDLEDPANPGMISAAGWKQFEDVFRWAKDNNQYVILDMHVAPGGQDPAPYEDGGHNLIWSDPVRQQRFVSLWTEIAKRCKDVPAVGAYELLNEPCTQTADPTKLVNLCARAITAIRAVDPNKVIVIPGNDWSNARNMVDAIKVSDPNVLYTFHFYNSGLPPQVWLANDKEGPGISGTQDWTKVDVALDVPEGALSMSPLLRSNNNSGSAWFDDLQITDWAGNVIQSESFDKGPLPYKPERRPGTEMTFDPTTGHTAPGSLCVSGTTTYNGWAGPHISVEGGRTYHLSAWVKLNNATGSTYITAAYYGIKGNTADKNAMLTVMAPAIAFQKKYNVPVWVGEFGCETKNLPVGLQASWVSTCISAFEQCGFSWSYWDFHETSAPGSMALQSEHRESGAPWPINNDLLAALQTGWQFNGKPAAVAQN